ncbi:PREDICTED: coiled-coil domain-containing protein KIAA1407 homolog isoform X1 [Calidris pugnax]|uniref:coiled-coil domain-containing protein KIAA1407 homolog isoform X1 n=1 Tax=Calidris pugnax TaxID=198806 RepID=UPI00071CEAFD|nr:PREDICTED: coiled-coil domain-containing protein KIAA1407 homolog isoform X1 [Calidris pugnax]
MEQLQDHDEACEEARELLSNWMKSKLQVELTNDGEEEVDSVLLEKPSAAPLKYERFDDLCSNLERELESSTVQEYLQHLLQSEAVNCGIAKNLRLEDIKEKQKLEDPRIIMELRHKQVKENRMRRQKALELQRQEKFLKKSILAEAKLQAQEEDRRKALKAKKEEEEIQREMVKLRKEMAEKRHTMAEARRMEGKTQEKSQKLSMQEVSVTAPLPLVQKKEEQEEEKQRRVQELLRRIHINKQRCMQRHFSAWLKVILEQRIKMRKARALDDWKCQLKALRAWRNYAWAEKLEQETQQLEVHLQDQNRKTQLSVEHNQRRLLRCCFLAWQRWSQAETEKRERQIEREETKRKMAQLLEAVSQGKGSLHGPLEVNKPGTAEVNHHQELQKDKPTETCLIQKEPDQTRDHSCRNAAHTPHSYRKPKFAWEITLKHAALTAQDQAVCRNRIAALPQKFHTPGPKTAPAYGSCFEHRHAFQQRLIEEQKQQLQKQQELILELQENQRLSRVKEEAAQATAVTQQLNNSASQTGKEKPKTENQSSSSVSHGPENTRAAMQGRRPSSQLTAHPILKAMEERATQRAERRRKLEEAKQRREEEKLAQLKAKEEERQRKEAEEKEAQKEKRREERRQQKLKELEKQKRLEKEQQLQRKARDHYEKVLLRKLGMVPWKRLREQAKENLMVAQRHHCLSLQRKCLVTWLQHTQETLMEKVSRAEDFYCRMLLRQGFRNWLKYQDYLSTLEDRASTFHAACLMKKYFWAWFDLVMEEKSTLWEKLKITTEHSNKRLLLNAFKAWRQYPLLMEKEREREERRNQLRRRVAEILPDFLT